MILTLIRYLLFLIMIFELLSCKDGSTGSKVDEGHYNEKQVFVDISTPITFLYTLERDTTLPRIEIKFDTIKYFDIENESRYLILGAKYIDLAYKVLYCKDTLNIKSEFEVMNHLISDIGYSDRKFLLSCSRTYQADSLFICFDEAVYYLLTSISKEQSTMIYTGMNIENLYLLSKLAGQDTFFYETLIDQKYSLPVCLSSLNVKETNKELSNDLSALISLFSLTENNVGVAVDSLKKKTISKSNYLYDKLLLAKIANQIYFIREKYIKKNAF